MDDRTLLERAAKAAGIDTNQWVEPGILLPDKGGFVQFVGLGHVVIWNGLTDDGDALRLAVKLGMILVIQDSGYVQAGIPGYQDCCEYEWSTAATRRAVVRAAAALAGDD